MENIFRRAGGLKWWPDADSVGAPDNVLLRADNTVPDEAGSRAVRMGSNPIYSGLQDQSVHSLYSAPIEGVLQRMAGIDDKLYVNGVAVGETFEGSGDIAFGDDAYQIVAARGATRKKWDGSTLNNWHIDAPSLAPAVVAVDAITDQVATMALAESPAFTINEGTSNFVSDWESTADEALELIPASTGRASAQKKFASDQDYQDIGGAIGGNTDLFDMRVWFENWRKVDKVSIMFGLGTGDDPFVDDYYYFDFNIRANDETDIKDPSASVAAAYAIAGNKAVGSLTPNQITNVRNATQAHSVLQRIGRLGGQRSTVRRDAQAASPAWGHLSVTRGQFTRVGGTSGRNWSTVRGFKIIYNALEGSTVSAYFDDAIWTGGGARSLTGTDFVVGYRFARRFQLADSTDVYYELSPMSPLSDVITLNQQTLQVTISATALADKDPQVTEVWAYLQGGWLDTFYRFAILPATPQTGLTIDELTTPTGSNFDSPEKRTRLTAWGFTISPGAGAASSNVVFTGNLSEIEILIDNESYTPGTMPIPENIIGVAGPFAGRHYLLDSEGWLHVTGSVISSVSAYHSIDLRKYGDPLWVARTPAGILAGCSRDIVRILGTGSESEDHVIVDLYAEPLGVGSPPVGPAIMVDGSSVVYRAADGPMILAGSDAQPIPYAGTSMLWRSQTRHSYAPINISTGRFRFEVDNHILYALIPEGSDTNPSAIWRYYNEEWCRLTYPFTPISIFREPSGALIVGATNGAIHEIESGNQDNGSNISVSILTPIGDGGSPLQRKDAVDLQIHVNTAGELGTLNIYKDGSSDSTSTVGFATDGPGVYRSDITDLGVFLRVQLEFTGSFSTLALHGYNVTYRSRPQQVMVLDPGYILPANGGDMAWVTEAEIDFISPYDLQVLVYRDDVLYGDPLTITTPGANLRTQRRVSLPRGSRARRLRLVTKTTAAAGAADPGFEPYSFKVRHRGAGNFTDLIPSIGDAA